LSLVIFMEVITRVLMVLLRGIAELSW